MSERLPTTGLGVTVRQHPFGVVAMTAIVLLCLLVAVVGAFAVVAQTVGTWESLFFMERAFALTVPTVKGLLAVSVVASMVFVLRR